MIYTFSKIEILKRKKKIFAKTYQETSKKTAPFIFLIESCLTYPTPNLEYLYQVKLQF
jgi:hypothetical protein